MTVETEEFVRALARGLAVIECFGPNSPALTLSQVAKEVGMNRATARRLLHTLTQLGYMGYDGKFFRLAPRVLQLGYAYLSTLDIWRVVQPYLMELVEQVEESCSVTVLDGAEVVYVARAPVAGKVMAINPHVGSRLPAHVSSPGRMLLAGLEPGELDRVIAGIGPLRSYTEYSVTDPDRLKTIIRQAGRQGWALVDQEMELGLRSIAVPIHDGGSKVIAALNVGGHTSRKTVEDMLGGFLPALQQTAERISMAYRTGRGS